MFRITSQYKKARVGVLKTEHGDIKTPNMAFVATHGNIRLLDAKEQRLAGPELIIANTFHLWVNDKVKEIKKAKGIHKYFKWPKPIMTDSGGFQVFSLGRTHGIGKIKSQILNLKPARWQGGSQKSQVKINSHGVIFNYNNRKYELTPEKSIKLQQDIRADIIFSFDECTSPIHNYAYNKKSLRRTHAWARRCLDQHKSRQLLFGIVQGGVYEKLRKQSSKLIGSLPFDGFGIGGSFGEKNMAEVIDWALSGLPGDKPRHGILYAKAGKMDYRKKGAKLYHIYKKDKIKAMKLATIHNIKFYKELFRKIRWAIKNKQNLNNLKKEYIVR